VLTDLTSLDAEDVEGEAPEAKALRLESHSEQVASFFQAMGEEASSKKASQAKFRPPRIANRYFCMAKDNALLRGIGKGISVFRSDAERPFKLDRTEFRFSRHIRVDSNPVVSPRPFHILLSAPHTSPLPHTTTRMRVG